MREIFSQGKEIKFSSPRDAIEMRIKTVSKEVRFLAKEKAKNKAGGR